MKNIISIIQIIISLALIGLIILQAQGSGLGSAWGKSSGFYYSKRGVEKIVLWLTISLTILFFISSILNFIY